MQTDAAPMYFPQQRPPINHRHTEQVRPERRQIKRTSKVEREDTENEQTRIRLQEERE